MKRIKVKVAQAGLSRSGVYFTKKALHEIAAQLPGTKVRDARSCKLTVPHEPSDPRCGCRHIGRISEGFQIGEPEAGGEVFAVADVDGDPFAGMGAGIDAQVSVSGTPPEGELAVPDVERYVEEVIAVDAIQLNDPPSLGGGEVLSVEDLGPEERGTVTCPQKDCGGEVDVPPGTLDGAALECFSCRLECYLVVGEDGSWWLDPGEAE